MPDTKGLPFTICFCTDASGRVLLLLRNKAPNQYKWNGVGGKIEANETPTQAIIRETMEETGLDISKTVRFGGVVLWSDNNQNAHEHRGMYVFVAKVPRRHVFWQQKQTREGLLAWQPAQFISPENADLVSNIPVFLPYMLDGQAPAIFQCTYHGDTLMRVDQTAMPRTSVLL